MTKLQVRDVKYIKLRNIILTSEANGIFIKARIVVSENESRSCGAMTYVSNHAGSSVNDREGMECALFQKKKSPSRHERSPNAPPESSCPSRMASFAMSSVVFAHGFLVKTPLSLESVGARQNRHHRPRPFLEQAQQH